MLVCLSRSHTLVMIAAATAIRSFFFCAEHGDVVKTGARGHVITFPFPNTVKGHAML